jgi:5-(aminomethyl)-3-furanmethanol phosphate kinase
MDLVVKVGGSLARGESLEELGARVAELGRRHRLLVVPGGGVFADAVREQDARFGLRPSTAHWMAVLAMEQYAHLLCELIPGGGLVRTLAEAEACAARGVAAVLLPWELLRHSEALPHSWAVTSDSIAAWIAREAAAPLLVLLKDRHGMACLETVAAAAAPSPRVTVTASELAAAEVVDGYFERVLEGTRFELWIVNGERPERLVELLESGSTEGVMLARSAP